MALENLKSVGTGLWDKTTGYVDQLTDFIYGQKSAITKVDFDGNITGESPIEINALSSISLNVSNSASKRQVESFSVFNDTIKKNPPSLSLTLVVTRDKVDKIKKLSDETSPINITINTWKENKILNNGILDLYYISSFSLKDSYKQKNTATIEITIDKIRTFQFYTESGLYSKYNENSQYNETNAGENPLTNALDPKKGFVEKTTDYVSRVFDIKWGW